MSLYLYLSKDEDLDENKFYIKEKSCFKIFMNWKIKLWSHLDIQNIKHQLQQKIWKLIKKETCMLLKNSFI